MPQWFARRYEIRGELGRGSYGVVHRAWDRNLGRELALKVFHQGAETLAIEEAHVLTALESPHMLRVFNADVYQDIPFITTLVAAERSAEDHLRDGLGLSPDLAIRWAEHLLIGLSVCHASGLLHRDLKPSNLFLHTDDHAALGDFGIAKRIDEQTRDAQAAGSWLTLAPEGFTTGRVTTASDIYSASATLWRMLTGAFPIDREERDELAEAVAAGERSRLRDVAPHIPRAVAAVVEKGLAVDPDARYGDAMQMHNALARIPRPAQLWVELVPHGGHTRCWRSIARGRASLTVCAIPQPTGAVNIETRRATGPRTRVLAHCRSCTPARLLIELRSVFDHA